MNAAAVATVAVTIASTRFREDRVDGEGIVVVVPSSKEGDWTSKASSAGSTEHASPAEITVPIDDRQYTSTTIT